VPDLLAIVSKAIFERDARVGGGIAAPGAVWPVDRYVSTNKALASLDDGGRLFLVTVRPPNEQLWLVAVIEGPEHDGTAWIGAPNEVPVTDITALRKTIQFESGKGMSQDKGTLGMSLQMPRALAADDVEQIYAVIAAPPSSSSQPPAPPKPRAPVKAKTRTIDGKYEILSELGRGGMGVVYEARHTGTHRRVAVKEIVGEVIDDKLLARFEREARATGAIETQHIPPVLDVGKDPTTKHPYLVMELLDGEDLQDRLVRSGPLREELALRVIAQACAGLARAHAAGVVHRDIKPANLFLAKRDDEVVVKVLDFGVARVKTPLAIDRKTLTVTGAMLGTPLYMSPEQVVGAKDLDHRADLWSLGVVLYELLVGQTPFEEVETLGALLVAICSHKPRPIGEATRVSPGTEAVVARALEPDVARRYQRADEMLADLRKLVPDTRLDERMLGAIGRAARDHGEDVPFAHTSSELRQS
jgi:serine/threonine protein kinase